MPLLHGTCSTESHWDPPVLPNGGVIPFQPPFPTDVLVLGGVYGLMMLLHRSAEAGGVTSLITVGGTRVDQCVCAGPSAGALGISQPACSMQQFSCEAQRDDLNNLIPGCDQAWRKGKGNKEAPSPEQQ